MISSNATPVMCSALGDGTTLGSRRDRSSMRSIATRSSSARMPDTIQTGTVAGQKVWFIWNETTEGENFAEKWNKDPRRAEAFFAWHARAVSDIERLADVEGIDQLRRMLGGALGSKPVGKALDEITDRVGVARRSGRLSVTPAGGLVVAAQSASTGVRANTFFGKNWDT
jgi:hypothetical protein